MPTEELNASEQITRFTTANGITRSIGRTGVCWGCDWFPRRRTLKRPTAFG